MVDDGKPKVLEFNVRLGDPEIQPVMRRFDGDWFDVLEKTVEGKLSEATLNWKKEAAVSVVIASGGYPGDYEKGKVISGLKEAGETGAVVFHCGTAKNGNDIVTAGGRVLGVCATGKNVRDAIFGAYYGVQRISFDQMFYRKDIGAKALRRPSKAITGKKAWLCFAGLVICCALWCLVGKNGWQLDFSGSSQEVKFLLAKYVVSAFVCIRTLIVILRNKLNYRIAVGTYAMMFFIMILMLIATRGK
jgi:hypothetical protein